MSKIIRFLFIWAFSILFIVSCSSPLAESTPSPATALPNRTSDSTITPTETQIQLPVFYGNGENEYCQLPSILLPIVEAQGLSEDEIVGKLMDLWLAYYYAPQAPDWCRIDGYQIEEVHFDESLSNLPLEPKGDFMRKVLFLIKLIQSPSLWDAWSGDIDQQNWLHTQAYIAVFRSDSGYTMKFARP